MLLYARTDEEIHPGNEYTMIGNRIIVKTFDLNCDFSVVSTQFNAIADSFIASQRPANKTRGLLWGFVGGKVESG